MKEGANATLYNLYDLESINGVYISHSERFQIDLIQVYGG